MTRDNLYKFFDDTMARCKKILAERNECRALDEDALSNLRGEALVCGKCADDHTLDYIGIKLYRIQHGHKQGEDITDDLHDMINYIVLFMVLKHKEPPKEE